MNLDISRDDLMGLEELGRIRRPRHVLKISAARKALLQQRHAEQLARREKHRATRQARAAKRKEWFATRDQRHKGWAAKHSKAVAAADGVLHGLAESDAQMLDILATAGIDGLAGLDELGRWKAKKLKNALKKVGKVAAPLQSVLMSKDGLKKLENVGKQYGGKILAASATALGAPQVGMALNSAWDAARTARNAPKDQGAAPVEPGLQSPGMQQTAAATGSGSSGGGGGGGSARAVEGEYFAAGEKTPAEAGQGNSGGFLVRVMDSVKAHPVGWGVGTAATLATLLLALRRR